MKVSIIIPVYNGEKYLDETIQSAIRQTLPKQDYEIIIVNDGSTDKTDAILAKYSEHLRIYQKTNGGTASALNVGIRNATGQWIKWLSADDILKPDALEKMLAFVTRHDRIYYTHYDRLTDGNVTLFSEPNNNYKSQFEKNVILLDHFYGNGSTSLIHRSVFEKCGLFDESVGYQEDYEFWLRCCIRYNIELWLLDINTLQYRVHDGQLTEQKKYDALKKSDLIRKPYLNDDYITALEKYQKKNHSITRRIKRFVVRRI